MKTGAGFSVWPEAERQAERLRYDQMLKRGLELLKDDLPPLRATARPGSH